MHCRGRDTTTVVLMFCTLLAHAFVNPLTHVIRQHTATPKLSIQGVLTRKRPAFLVDREPAQYFRASHNHYAGPHNCRCHNSHPKTHRDQWPRTTQHGQCPPILPPVPSRLFRPTHQLPHYVHERCVWPIRQFDVVDGPLGPPVSQEVLSLLHGTFSRFQLGVAIDAVHNRFAVASDFQGRLCPASGISSTRRQPLVSLSAFWSRWVRFLLHRLFIDSRLRITSSLRTCSCHKLYLPSPAHLAIGVSYCTPLLWNPIFVLPPLYVVGVPRHSPRGSASPPSGSSPPQNGKNTQHNRDITFVNGPGHSGPDFVRDFFGQ